MTRRRPSAALPRRAFLRSTGAAAAGLLLAGCGGRKDRPPTVTAEPGPRPVAMTLDLSEATGALNFLYALEQVEVAFYVAVTDRFYSGASSAERRILGEIRAHELAHRDVLRAVLADDAIGDLATRFDRIDLTARRPVLEAAVRIERLSVGARNGLARHLVLDGPLGDLPLTFLGDTVGVEARHAATLSELLHGADADALAAGAFDPRTTPRATLRAASAFLDSRIDVTGVSG